MLSVLLLCRHGGVCVCACLFVHRQIPANTATMTHALHTYVTGFLRRQVQYVDVEIFVCICLINQIARFKRRY